MNKLMNASEIRSKFLDYFESQGHQVVESSSLVPHNDPTLLFTNAGMNQFKDVFTGKENRTYKRATTSQKVVRAGGKHNDLENVGFTGRHLTFFEMLGNFSFGDYFKKEAIAFAWNFVCNHLKVDKQKLYVTVHVSDDEAAEIWQNQEGVPKDRIFRFDEDNFWSMGDIGPCGPCTEIFFDRGKEYSCGQADCQVGCECDRYMEFWNLVFMQYERDASGQQKPLPKPSVDTGMGLERIATILQNVDSVYESDALQDIIFRTAKLAGKKYDPKNDVASSFRAIADHSRSTCFLIADGVMPSNEGRGYVLRRIMRRAIRLGKKINLNEPFLHKTIEFVIDQMLDAYPELGDKRSFIQKVVLAEEEQFFKTLERGLSLLEEECQKLGKKTILDGEVAFKLYDTYGFPLDLTRVILRERDLEVDEKGFEKAMERQKEASRKNWKGSGEEATDQTYFEVFERLRDAGRAQVFTGYQSLEEESEILALWTKSDKGIQEVREVQAPGGKTIKCQVLFERSPFYGESGGQAGDRGMLKSIDGSPEIEARVVDAQKPIPELIVCEIELKSGSLKVGESVFQVVNKGLRDLTARNHTATHLLHWALAKVLGDHVKQAGSLVNDHLLRFDFSHFQPMTPEEIEKVENLINQKIWANDPVTKQVMAKEQAIAAGAIAFFGEKYGDQVRVVKVGDFSTELCGGTHIDHSSEIHLFKIASESGIAAGVRRIVAYTSQQAFRHLYQQDREIQKMQGLLKASSPEDVTAKIAKLQDTERQLRKQIESFQSQSLGIELQEIISKAQEINGTPVFAAECQPDDSGIKRLREMADRLKQKAPNGVVVLGIADQSKSKAFLLSAIGPKAPQDKVKANEIIKHVGPLIGGKGGGKPDLAQGGGNQAAQLGKAIEEAQKLVTQWLS